MTKAVFLDRDNTLIRNDGDLGDPTQVTLLPGVADALRALRHDGFRLIVVTNQGGVARGRYTERDVDAVHQRIAELVDEAANEAGLIDRFYYCPYHPEGTVAEYRREHPWRKPHPGMLIQAGRDLGLDLTQSWMIGDQARDIVAGRSAGCHTIMISGDQSMIAQATPHASAASFPEAVDIILSFTASVRDAASHAEDDPPDNSPDDSSHHGNASVEDGVQATPRPVQQGPSGSSAVIHEQRLRLPVQVRELPTEPTAALPDTRVNPSTGPATSSRRRSTNSSDPGQDSTEIGVSRSRTTATTPSELGPLVHALHELAEEIKGERLRRSEFTAVRMVAGVCQLLAVLCAVLGLLQLGTTEDGSAYLQWILGGIFLQLGTVALLLLDLRG